MKGGRGYLVVRVEVVSDVEDLGTAECLAVGAFLNIPREESGEPIIRDDERWNNPALTEELQRSTRV